MSAVNLLPTSPAEGCTAPDCGSQDTASLDSFNGRRCGSHAPAFEPARAVELMRAGEPGDAMAYLRHFNEGGVDAFPD